MIDLHYWTTPNGHKVTMFLEESALPYRIVPVNISKGDQFKPEFLAISPNNRIPAIVDHSPKDGGKPISVFESGAILLYLAEKTGMFLPSELRRKVGVIQWLFWQMGGLGPMAGQNHHFGQYAPEKLPYALGYDDNADVATLIGYASRKLGRYDDAKLWYERALAADPNHAVTWSYYGMWQAEQGNVLKAKDDLEKVRLICGTDCRAYRMLKDAIDGTATY